MYSFIIINFFPMVLVDENPYYFAAAGGVLLGIATSLNYCLRGRVTGMSGTLYGILTLHKGISPARQRIWAKNCPSLEGCCWHLAYSLISSATAPPTASLPSAHKTALQVRLLSQDSHWEGCWLDLGQSFPTGVRVDMDFAGWQGSAQGHWWLSSPSYWLQWVSLPLGSTLDSAPSAAKTLLQPSPTTIYIQPMSALE